MRKHLTNTERIIIFFAYLIMLLGINLFLFNSITPNGYWFTLAFFSFLLSALLSEPHYTTPRDAQISSMTLIVSVIYLGLESQIPQGSVNFWVGLLIFAIVIFVVATLAQYMGKSSRQQAKTAGDELRHLSSLIGSPRVMFTSVFFLSIGTFHTDTREILILLGTWMVIVFWRPLESLWLLALRYQKLRYDFLKVSESMGTIVSRQTPGTATMQIAGVEFPSIGTLVIIPISTDKCEMGFIIDNYRLADALWSRIMLFEHDVPISYVPRQRFHEGLVYKCNPKHLAAPLLESEIYRRRDDIIGYVVEQSNISSLQVELLQDEAVIFEGQLIIARIKENDVLYQIMDGVTASETLSQSNRHGFIRMKARKLGIWNDSTGTFEQVVWTPDLYSPIFRFAANVLVPTFNSSYVGQIPSTSYGLSIDCNSLISHNTAILGVIGTGKTKLALELIIRLVNEGKKIWIIDITGEYRKALRALRLVNVQEEDQADRTLGSSSTQAAFESELKKHAREFFNHPSWMVRVFNPRSFKVKGKVQVTRSSSSLDENITEPQITQLVAEALLAAVENEMVDRGRLMLVLEEGHSLIPEWSFAAYESDSRATVATARAIMQGRKYGYGCLLIAQRTAHVSKSIINQCNTVFALRMFDERAEEFLRAYIGEDYASSLPTLPNRQCVAYGLGVKSSVPLRIVLNDWSEFEDNFPVDPKYIHSDDSSDIPF